MIFSQNSDTAEIAKMELFHKGQLISEWNFGV